MILISLSGNAPIFEQIQSQIIRFVDLGVLEENEKLPSVRTLALDLGINPNTIQRAYSNLEELGYIYTLPKKGAFVAKKNVDKSTSEFGYTVKDFVKKAKDSNLSLEDVYKYIKEEWNND